MKIEEMIKKLNTIREIRDMKPICGFEDYLISKSGIVYSLKSNKFLSIGNNATGGYYYVDLYKDGKKYRKRIHVIVMETFSTKPNLSYEIDHKDGNKSNNNLSNLEYVTHAENVRRYHSRKMLTSI